jgi:hypothetical protein
LTLQSNRTQIPLNIGIKSATTAARKADLHWASERRPGECNTRGPNIRTVRSCLALAWMKRQPRRTRTAGSGVTFRFGICHRHTSAWSPCECSAVRQPTTVPRHRPFLHTRHYTTRKRMALTCNWLRTSTLL